MDVTPPGHVHALDLDDARRSDLTVFGIREAGELVAVGALRALGDGHVERKSMYLRLGFTPCGPFGDYADDPLSQPFFTIEV